MYRAAVFSDGRIAEGNHHGDAYSRLCNTIDDDLLVSGHMNGDGSFTSESPHIHKNLIIIRHAQTYHSIGETNDPDSELTPEGYQQALRLAQELSCYKGYKGYCSPLWRCLLTSKPIHEITGIPFQVDDNIADDDGMFLRKEEFPEFDWSSSISLIDRLSTFLKNAADNSIIVTHGICVMTLIELALGAGLKKIKGSWDGSIPNASLSVIDSEGTLQCIGKTL